jgi:transcription initiation factor TFIIIB Brf1 subunit/transcription initiation factor TFIIB
MDGFALIDDIDSFYAGIDDSVYETIAYDICSTCGVQMNDTGDNTYVCPQCHVLNDKVEVTDMSTMTSDSSYNTSYGTHNQIRFVGSNRYKYQHLLRGNSDYSLIQEQNIRKILFDCNYVSDTDINVPKDILLIIADHYKSVRESNNIYRGTILRGILAAMTYYVCLEKQLAYKPNDISVWFGISDINYSKGDKIVLDLIERGILNINRHIKAEHEFIFSYSTRLGFDKTQIEFLTEIMERVLKMRLVNPNSKPSTKALSIIYMFILAAKINIDSETLHTRFNASFGTIRSTSSDLINNISLMKDIFDKYDIPTKIVRTRKKRVTKKVQYQDEADVLDGEISKIDK